MPVLSACSWGVGWVSYAPPVIGVHCSFVWTYLINHIRLALEILGDTGYWLDHRFLHILVLIHCVFSSHCTFFTTVHLHNCLITWELTYQVSRQAWGPKPSHSPIHPLGEGDRRCRGRPPSTELCVATMVQLNLKKLFATQRETTVKSETEQFISTGGEQAPALQNPPVDTSRRLRAAKKQIERSCILYLQLWTSFWSALTTNN